MNKQIKKVIHRYALLKAYDGKCFYCGSFIATVYDLEEDHIIPQHYIKKPEDLHKVLKEYGLPEDFEINAYYNRVPSHSGCNKRKRSLLYEKETTHHYLNLAKNSVEKIKEIEDLIEKKALANEELFEKGFGKDIMEKFLKIIEENPYIKENYNDNRGTSHRNQDKWQKFYNRMVNTKQKYLGIDIQNLLNRKIQVSDFEEVLKMNIGSRHKYYKIYNNEDWFFSFMNNRMGGNYYEIFVRDENTHRTYDFFKPNLEKHTLKKWSKYIVECCANEGITVKNQKIITKTPLIPSPNLTLFFNKEGTKKIIQLPIKNEISNIITAEDIRMKERKRYKRIDKKIEYDIFFRNNIQKKEEQAVDITKQFYKYYQNRKIDIYLFNVGTETCNDIDLTIEITLEKSFKIRHKSQIQKPSVNSSLHFPAGKRTLLGAYEKIWELRKMNKEEYPFEYEDLRIKKKECGKGNKWQINYHVDYLRHNDVIPLESLKVYIPEKPQTRELVFKYSFIQRESGKVQPQELKINLI